MKVGIYKSEYDENFYEIYLDENKIFYVQLLNKVILKNDSYKTLIDRLENILLKNLQEKIFNSKDVEEYYLKEKNNWFSKPLKYIKINHIFYLCSDWKIKIHVEIANIIYDVFPVNELTEKYISKIVYYFIKYEHLLLLLDFRTKQSLFYVTQESKKYKKRLLISDKIKLTHELGIKTISWKIYFYLKQLHKHKK